MKFADLHLHTLFSDGTYTPQELVAKALEHDLAAIAIVDHDTVEAIAPALETKLAKDIEILPGIELTAEQDDLEIHILGYLIDYKNKEFIKKLDFLKQNRIERIYKITEKLKALGITLEPQAVFEIAKQGTVGRMHIARALVKEGKVNSAAEAFYKYIGDKCPAYVSGFKLSPKEAIRLIKGVAGIPVLAHPYTLKRDDLIPVFVQDGLMGLEAYYPEHTKSMTDSYLGLARKYNLLVTGGSDCHGEAKPEIRIGSLKVSYKLVEELKRAKEKL